MYSDKDYSLYDNIPKQWAYMKNKNFNEWEIPPWDLIIDSDKILGEGNFGKVHLASWRGSTVAAKIMNENIKEEKKKLFIREFDTMSKLHHPNIIQLFGYIENPFIIVMEYFENGDLLSYSQKKILFRSKKIEISLDILKGLYYLHKRKPQYIIHRDLKSQNILITLSGKAKIGDFGLSRILNHENDIEENKEEIKPNNSLSELSTFVGTIRYMSPEVKNKDNYCSKSDIWSCGIILCELFEDTRYNNNFVWIRTPTKIKNIIVKNMLRENPDERLNASDLINEFIRISKTNCICM